MENIKWNLPAQVNTQIPSLPALLVDAPISVDVENEMELKWLEIGKDITLCGSRHKLDVFVSIYSLGLTLQNCLFCSLGASVYLEADNILILVPTRRIFVFGEASVSMAL